MNKEIDVPTLRDFFSAAECPGVVSLIDYLASPEGAWITCIGSSTIDFEGVLGDDKRFRTDAEKASAVFFLTHSLHIGSNDGSVMPLEWLFNLSRIFDSVSAKARRRFDEVCGELAAISHAPAVEDATIFGKDGKRTVI